MLVTSVRPCPTRPMKNTVMRSMICPLPAENDTVSLILIRTRNSQFLMLTSRLTPSTTMLIKVVVWVMIHVVGVPGSTLYQRYSMDKPISVDLQWSFTSSWAAT